MPDDHAYKTLLQCNTFQHDKLTEALRFADQSVRCARQLYDVALADALEATRLECPEQLLLCSVRLQSAFSHLTLMTDAKDDLTTAIRRTKQARQALILFLRPGVAVDSLSTDEASGPAAVGATAGTDHLPDRLPDELPDGAERS